MSEMGGVRVVKKLLNQSRTVVSNLGYVKNLKRYASSEITLIFSMKQLNNAY